MKENKHFFLDGYDINTEILANINKMEQLTQKINKELFNNKGKIVIIPYFNGKIKEDGGVSGIVLGDNSHFTCHTFCYKNTFFLDYYGNEVNHKTVKNTVLEIYPTKNIDLCNKNKNIKGNFGKHIIIKNNIIISFKESKKIISKILKEINMTPINSVITNYKNKNEFDLLQPIAESHISIHKSNDNIVIDAFSCKWFDEEKLLKILNAKKYEKINRGIRYK